MSERIKPGWRSMMFVPAHVQRMVDGIVSRGCDACILDLEDSVPDLQKSLARELLPAHVAGLGKAGMPVLVRINADRVQQASDIAAAVMPGVAALVVPKVNCAADLLDLIPMLERQEAVHGPEAAPVWLIAQIEDVAALPALDAIARATPRLLAMTLGSEDFSASAGMVPSAMNLFMPNQQVLFACRRAGVLPFGFPGSIAEYSDMDAFSETVHQGRQMGFAGAFCIHPRQIPVLNRAFSPTEDEIAHAEGVLAAFAEAGRAGMGAVAYKGRMIDPPVVRMAEQLLARRKVTLAGEQPQA